MDTVLLAVRIIGGTVAFALAGLWLSRRVAREETLHDVAGYLIAVVGAVYAVVLGFVTVTVWDDFGEASRIVSREATEATAAYRMAAALPDPGEASLRLAIADYVKAAREEWPALAEGRASPEARRALERVLHARAAVAPVTPRDQVLYEALVHSLHEVSLARDLRLLAARETMHPVGAFVLGGGAVITIAFTWLFRLGRLRVQAAMTAGVAALIALNLFLIAATDRPFSGAVRVPPHAFDQALLDIADLDRGAGVRSSR
jgi:hypothetical protein